MSDHLLHRARIRARGLHPLLRLADLGDGDHLERARHLAGVLHALDLGFDFSAAGHFFFLRRAGLDPPWALFRCRDGGSRPALHHQLPVAWKSAMPCLKLASSSSFQFPVLLIVSMIAPAVLAKCACRPSSKASSLLTGISST